MLSPTIAQLNSKKERICRLNKKAITEETMERSLHEIKEVPIVHFPPGSLLCICEAVKELPCKPNCYIDPLIPRGETSFRGMQAFITHFRTIFI